MKTYLLAPLLLLFVQVAASPANKTGSFAGDREATVVSDFWPKGTTVKVYFVQSMFTSEQRQMLFRTLEMLTLKAETNSTIRFLYAGEIGGLIDCLGCLTLTRQEVHTNESKRKASFNRLRDDQMGQLISA